MKRFLLVLVLAFFSILSIAQLPHGAPAPNIVVTDINGGSFNLYSYTGSKRGVVLDFMATWCPPCWGYHNSGTLTRVLNDLGPGGLNIAGVVMLEADTRTNVACLYDLPSCSYSTLGNWTNVPYQIADLTPSNGLASKTNYAISYYPTYYVISHDNRAFQLSSPSYGTLRNWLEKSFFLDVNPVITNSRCGDDGQIDLNRVHGYGGITYEWSNGDKTEDLVNIGAGSYSVTIEDGNGYFRTFGPFIVNGPTEPLSIELTEIQDVECFGEYTGSIEIEGRGGNGGYSYAWSNGQTGPIAVGLSAGPHIVTITDIMNCTEVETYFVKEAPLLIATGLAEDEECGKMNGVLYVYGNGGTRPYTFDIGNGPTSSSTFYDLASGTYEVTVTDRYRCSAVFNGYVGSRNGPEARAGDDKNFDCASTEIIINGSGSTGNRYSYLWTTQDGNIVGPNDELTVKVDAPGTYQLSVTDDILECETVDEIEVKDVRVYPDIVLEDAEILTCDLETQILKADGGIDNDVEWWTVDGNILSKEDSIAIEINAPGTYYVRSTDPNTQCETTDSLVVEEDIDEPEFELEDAIAQLCPDDELLVLIEELDSLGQFEIHWTTIDGNILDGEDNDSLTVNAPGKYYVEVKDLANGCIMDDSVEVKEEWNLPESIFAADANDLEVEFEDQSEGNPTAWNWTFGDGNSSNDQHPIHTYAAEGRYEVCLEIVNECTTHKTCDEVEVEEMTTSASDNFASGISVYPNPARNNAFIDSGNEVIKDIAIYYLDGRVVIGQDVIEENNVTSLNLVGLPEGCYHLVLFGQNGVQAVKKLVVIR